jgi:hypothetical protein
MLNQTSVGRRARLLGGFDFPRWFLNMAVNFKWNVRRNITPLMVLREQYEIDLPAFAREKKRSIIEVVRFILLGIFPYQSPRNPHDKFKTTAH